MKPRLRRIRRIRRYVVTTTVTIFLAVWSVIYAETISGHDAAAHVSAQSSTSSTSSSSASSASTGSAPSAVTTQQS